MQSFVTFCNVFGYFALFQASEKLYAGYYPCLYERALGAFALVGFAEVPFRAVVPRLCTHAMRWIIHTLRFGLSDFTRQLIWFQLEVANISTKINDFPLFSGVLPVFRAHGI
jgi:hypothetical protein